MTHAWKRLEYIVGRSGLTALAQASVVICGLGGVGGHAAEALVRSGIGRVVLIDHDRVAVSNINRQLAALRSTLGMRKVDVVARRLRDINPQCDIRTHGVFVSGENAASLIAADTTYVVDAIDSVAAKTGLIAYCCEAQVPIVASMGAGNKRDPAKLLVGDISETHTCPLARAVRQQLRRLGIQRGVKVVFSAEPSEALHISVQEDRRTPGSTAFVPPAAGLLLASVVVNDILNAGVIQRGSL